MTQQERQIFNEGYVRGQNDLLLLREGREPPSRESTQKTLALLRLYRRNTEGVTFYQYILNHWDMTQEQVEQYNKDRQAEKEKAELFKNGSFLERLVSWITKK